VKSRKMEIIHTMDMDEGCPSMVVKPRVKVQLVKPAMPSREMEVRNTMVGVGVRVKREPRPMDVQPWMEISHMNVNMHPHMKVNPFVVVNPWAINTNVRAEIKPVTMGVVQSRPMEVITMMNPRVVVVNPWVKVKLELVLVDMARSTEMEVIHTMGVGARLM